MGNKYSTLNISEIKPFIESKDFFKTIHIVSIYALMLTLMLIWNSSFS